MGKLKVNFSAKRDSESIEGIKNINVKNKFCIKELEDFIKDKEKYNEVKINVIRIVR